MRYFIIAIFCCFSQLNASSWAEKTLHKMTLDEKIGQLFMVAAYVDPDYAMQELKNPQYIANIDQWITKYHVGGLCFVGPSNSTHQVNLTNRYQSMSRFPLLIAQDAEWGHAMRLSDGMRFPKNITLGGVQDLGLIHAMGMEIGRQAKLLGIHMNLSPVLDVNTNPENPAINVRSYGSDPHEVADKGIAMIRGLQDAGIAASAKHFPGLGNIDTDPHLDLPISHDTREYLDEMHLYPFKRAIEAGVLSIQTEHIYLPLIEPTPHTAASLSPEVVQKILKDEMGFRGLVMSGALRMGALANHLPPDQVIVRAFLAGSDMLLMPIDLPAACQALKSALQDHVIQEKEIDVRVLKILQLKEKLGIHQQRMVAMPTQEKLHTPQAQQLKKRLYQQAVGVLRGRPPFIKGPKVGYIEIGAAPNSIFLNMLQKTLKIELTSSNNSKLDQYSSLVVALFPLDPRRIAQIRLLNETNRNEELKLFKVHGITPDMLKELKNLEKFNNKITLVLFGNPYALPLVTSFSSLIMAYEDDDEAQFSAAEIVVK